MSEASEIRKIERRLMKMSPAARTRLIQIAYYLQAHPNPNSETGRKLLSHIGQAGKKKGLPCVLTPEEVERAS